MASLIIGAIAFASSEIKARRKAKLAARADARVRALEAPTPPLRSSPHSSRPSSPPTTGHADADLRADRERKLDEAQAAEAVREKKGRRLSLLRRRKGRKKNHAEGPEEDATDLVERRRLSADTVDRLAARGPASTVGVGASKDHGPRKESHAPVAGEGLRPGGGETGGWSAEAVDVRRARAGVAGGGVDPGAEMARGPTSPRAWVDRRDMAAGTA